MTRAVLQVLITAFGLTVGLTVSLAGEGAVAPCAASVVVTLHADDTASVGQWTTDGVVAGSETTVTLDDLGGTIDARTGGNRDCRIMILVDREVVYGGVMIYLQSLQDAGYAKVALVAEEVIEP